MAATNSPEEPASLRNHAEAPAGVAVDEAPERPAEKKPKRRWWKRWLLRLGIAALVLDVLVTVFSFSYNAATTPHVRPPAGLRYVHAGDLNTRYRTWGSAGSPVVLVHGFAESADTWDRMARVLARDHRVYAYDVDGFGYTGRRGPYTIDHLATQLLDFLSVMKITRPVLVGHSSGAAVIAKAAMRAPGRVGGLMFLDGDALSTSPGPPPAVRKYAFADPYRTTILRMVVLSDTVIKAIYNSQCGPACPRLDKAGVAEWRRPFQVPGAEHAVWAMANGNVVGMSAKAVAGLRKVHVPKSVVFGAEDDVFAKKGAAQTSARIGAPAPTLIPNARHLSMISHPAAVAAAVEALATRAATS